MMMDGPSATNFAAEFGGVTIAPFTFAHVCVYWMRDATAR
jgi:hypothetical protein